MTARVQVLPRTYPKYQPELDRRVKQRESYGGDLPMLRFLGVAAGHQPPDDTERSLTQDEVVIQGKWVRSFRAFDTYNVYQSDQAIEIRHILDKDPAPRKDRKTKTSASSAFGKALRILLYYLLNTRVLQTYGWTPEPVAKLTPPGELAQRVDEPGDKFETAIARLTPDWVNWVLKRVQQLNEKIDDLPASSGDQLFYRAHVYTPGKIRKFQAIRNLELLASHLYYIINPSLRPDSTSLDAMDWGQENNQAIEEQGFLLEHAECIQRHIDQEQDPEAKARLAEARLNVTSTGGHYDSAFMRSMIISPLVLLSDAQVDTIQVTYAVGLQTILVQAQRVRPAMLVNVENLLLRQLLLVADGKQTVIDLLRNMHSALDAMKDLDNVSLEDRQFFANMLNPPELTSPSPTPPPPSPSPSVPAGAHEALDHLPGDDSGTVGEKRKRTTTDKQGLGQGTETSSDLVSSPTKKTCTITPNNIGSPASPGDDIKKEPDSKKDNYALKSGFGEKGSNDVNQDSGSVMLQPKMDLHDNKHKNITTATFELPGVEKTDYSIDIMLSLGQLIVSGEFKMPTECDEEGYTARERQFGRFRRTLQLPSGISHTQIEHDLRSGILTIKYPTVIL